MKRHSHLSFSYQELRVLAVLLREAIDSIEPPPVEPPDGATKEQVQAWVAESDEVGNRFIALDHMRWRVRKAMARIEKRMAEA